jgi:intracellular septation protein A
VNDTTVPTGLPIIPGDDFVLPPVRVKDMLVGSGPRLAVDAMGPMLAFYAGWRIFGLVAGIAAATVVSFVALRVDARQGRRGLLVRIGFAVVIVQGVVGLVSGSEQLYLAQPAIVSGGYGLAFVVSVLIGRPLTAAFAEDMYPFPDEVKASDTYRRAFSHITLAWGVYLLARSALRVVTLTGLSVEAFLVINFVTGAPITAALLGWSIWYGVRYFRRSEEWGPAIAFLDELNADAQEVKS